MTEVRHLRNAPITEALIDLRARLPAGFDPETFSGLGEELADRYPKPEKRQLVEQKIEIGLGSSHHPPQRKGLVGFFFRSEDERNLAQFRIDGFTFNRLKPYTTWEEVSQEARRLWTLYCQAASPESVTRAAVRYINHIPIPAPIGDMSDYLTTPMPIPEGLPGAVSSLLTKVVIRDEKAGLAANITQGLEEDIQSRSVTIILDIDAYKKREFEPQDDELWSTLEALRNLKNEIFFGSLADKLVRSFE